MRLTATPTVAARLMHPSSGTNLPVMPSLVKALTIALYPERRYRSSAPTSNPAPYEGDPWAED